ncbi:unnamed protein product, partial [Rotaria socialis]
MLQCGDGYNAVPYGLLRGYPGESG